jgi:hypothetical protein
MNQSSLDERIGQLEVYGGYLDLCARYVRGVDHREREAFASCWIPDAHWNFGEREGNYSGIDAIIANWESLGRAFHELHHVTTNHQITEYGERRGRGRCDTFVPGVDSEGTATMSSASCLDLFVQADDGLWRFAKRDITLHFHTRWLQPPSIAAASRSYPE